MKMLEWPKKKSKKAVSAIVIILAKATVQYQKVTYEYFEN